MNPETFTIRKNLLEEFFEERVKFNISKIEILQDNPDINIYELVNIFFKTHINFTANKFLIREFYNHLKPIICFAYSYTIRKKFINENFILMEGNTIINYSFEDDNKDLYIKNLEVILRFSR